MQANDASAEYDESLTEYIAKCKQRLNDLLGTIGWTQAEVLKHFNTNSLAAAGKAATKIPPRTHNEREFPTSCCRNAAHAVHIAQAELQSIVKDANAKIPQKFSELQLNFNREQKLAIYEHVTGRTGRLTEPEKQLVGVGEQTLAEIVAVKKQEKKKRRRYRRSKPSFIEEVRAVVELQMQAMQQLLGNNAKTKEQHAAKAKYERTNRADSKQRESSYRREKRQRSRSAERVHSRAYKRERSSSSGRYQSSRRHYEHDDRHRVSKHNDSHKSETSPHRHISHHKSKRTRSRSKTPKRRRERSRSSSYRRSNKHSKRRSRSRSANGTRKRYSSRDRSKYYR